MQNKTHILVGALLCVCAMPPFAAHAQLVGTDNVPGTACSAKGAVQMTANATGPGAYILTCDGDAPTGKWVATINAELPTANAQVANKEYVDMAVAAGTLPVCTDNYASLCALETSRADNDPEFTAANIADGVNILGVTGTLTNTPTGPADCPTIGERCTDTTIFVGFHPVLWVPMFIPPIDQDSGSGLKWKVDALGNGDHINPDSHMDGRANFDNIQTAISNLPAMEVCENLSLGGKDWYLPSIGELTVLYGVRSTLVAKSPGNNFTNFLNAHYWSSTEYNANVSWSLNFSSGFYDRPGKTTANRVRCVAR